MGLRHSNVRLYKEIKYEDYYKYNNQVKINKKNRGENFQRLPNLACTSHTLSMVCLFFVLTCMKGMLTFCSTYSISYETEEVIRILVFK